MSSVEIDIVLFNPRPSADRTRLFVPQLRCCWEDSVSLNQQTVNVRTVPAPPGRCGTLVTEFVARVTWASAQRCSSALISTTWQVRTRPSSYHTLSARYQSRPTIRSDVGFLCHDADTIDPEHLAPAIAIPTRNRMDMDPTRFGTQSMAQM